MAGVEDAKFTGLSRYFNSYTNFGRANVAKATYAGMALFFVYYKLKPAKKA